MLVEITFDNGDIAYICSHDRLVFRSKEEHCCPHELIGECLSWKCVAETRGLDAYGNCSLCGSTNISERRAKFTWDEVVKTFPLSGLEKATWTSLSRPTRIANLRAVARRLLTRLLNRMGFFNREPLGDWY